jgi:hypothetical protein
MWASVYITAGATATPVTAQVVSVGAGVNGVITLSTTVKVGTFPVSGTNTRTIKVGGAWASVLAPVTLGTVTLSFSFRLNIKAGSYASQTTNSRSLSLGGAAGVIVWYRGYKTTPGDMDAMTVANVASWTIGTDCPYWLWTTGKLTQSGKGAIMSGLAIVSANTASATLQAGQSNVYIHRCHISNASGTSNAIAPGGQANWDVEACYICGNSTAAAISTGASITVRGCYIKGGLNGVSIGVAAAIVSGNVIDSPAGDAITVTVATAQSEIYGNIINTPGGHGISLVSTLTTRVAIVGNCFRNVIVGSKYPISYGAGGTDVNGVHIASNTIYNCNAGTDANGISTGLGDLPAFDTLTESTDPYPNAASHTFVYAGTTGQGGGFPTYFQDNDDATSFLSNRDPGTTDHVASGAAGMLYIPNLEGI